MSFKDDFLRTPPGPKRDSLVYNAILSQGPPKNLVPVTVTGANGIKITYRVMPDYVMVDGIRVPLPPAIAQKVANHFGMWLPTDKMSQQIYQAADTKLRAPPLSGSGYVGSDGKKYTPQDVITQRIGASDAAVYYNNLTNKEIAKLDKKPTLIAGHGKDILEPLSNNPEDVSMGGWQGMDKKPLQPYSSPHKGEAENHTEYALFTRLIGNDAVITMPDGRTVSTTLDKIRQNPSLSQIVANKPNISKYTPSAKTQNVATKQSPSNAKRQSSRLSLLQKIDSFLNQFK